jgi:transposase
MNSAQLSQTEPSTIWRTPDELWQRIAPVLVIDKLRKKPGRPRVNDRRIFDGLIYLARTGGQWCALP